MENNLKKYMANLHVLMHNTLNFHWNVTGGLFLTLHELYQKHYEFLFKNIDRLAELMKGRNMYPIIAFEDIVNLSDLNVYPAKDYAARETIEALLMQYPKLFDSTIALAKFASEKQDLPLEDFFVELSKFLDKQLYLLRQFLKQ